MTDFDYDCLQKKRIARGAIHRKNGSKSKKCKLSSDNLTHKEWKEKCGMVESYNFNAPITWRAFKKMPIDIQKEYICGLVNKYNANYTALSRVFNATPATISAYSTAHSFGLDITTGTKMTPNQKTEWEKFIGINTPCKEEIESDENVLPEETAIAVKCDEVCTSIVPLTMTHNMRMNSASVEFEGEINVEEIANSLRCILGDKSVGKVCISYLISA